MMERLRAGLAHRGRSSQGDFARHPRSLHCARHAVIAVEAAQQPLRDSRNELVMVGNGEILNYKELEQQLSCHTNTPAAARRPPGRAGNVRRARDRRPGEAARSVRGRLVGQPVGRADART
ncbi:hypothetical protein ID875_30630 [Streptomyces globisporus]|uniref:Glutamine amidotransferase type-2 domain-containing protein n=1 Tax=Streptomyces globisporus TaxID=1908 RepID=A0A927BMV3_STRGL|nr:hypothetical protein [Streptomyces globisporus]